MASFKITGGNKLHGEITPQGAKNEALQILCATLLTPEKVTINNIPDIRDVNKLIVLLGKMGVQVEKIKTGTYTFQADTIDLEYMKTEDFVVNGGSLRGSIMIIGPLLARFRKAYMPQPGGDKIGRRRLDTHFIGLQKLGANLDYDEKAYLYKLDARNLEGAYMLLDEASVTGTANILMVAVLAKKKTTVYYVACDPDVLQLCNMLNIMGV